jgi:hypothetical protein
VIYARDGSTSLVAEQGRAWDAVLVVRYPRREAFSQMFADPEYQQVTHLRTEALIEAVLQATVPAGRRMTMVHGTGCVTWRSARPAIRVLCTRG